MKLLQSHEDYIKGVLENLFMNELDIRKSLPKWVNAWYKYGDHFYNGPSEAEYYDK